MGDEIKGCCSMIPIQNIYYMLSYAFRILRKRGYRNVATEQFHNVADLCAEILIKGVSDTAETWSRSRVHREN